MRQITSSLDFLPWKWILWPKKMNARDVYFSAQGLKRLISWPSYMKGKADKSWFSKSWWYLLKRPVAQWLSASLHSRPVFRDGFLLAYTMWCCTILPSRFQFEFEKMKPQLTSKRSVLTLMDEGINTHTQEGRNTSLVPPEMKNKHHMRSFFSPKESIYRVKNLKFSFMGDSLRGAF